MRILQTNLGRSRRAQDLLYQTVRESAVALAVVAEPYRVLDAPDWTGDADEMVAVTGTSTPRDAHTRSPAGAQVRIRRGRVCRYGGGGRVRISGWAAFEELLDGVGDCVRRHLPRQILVLGDFNAHSAEWGNPRTNARGRALPDWAAGLGLLLVNRGSTSTCATWRGCFVVDITWASPDTFRRITGWRVAEGIETLSDHLYIFMEVKDTPGPGTVTTGNGRDLRRRGCARPPPRWKIKETDGDLLRAAATVAVWNWETPMTQTETSVEEETKNLRQVMTAICDASMPRTTLGSGRSRVVHWWTPDIAELRARCVWPRRRYLRARCWRRRDEEEVQRPYQAYRALQRSLQKVIKAAKNNAWSELVEAVEADPWGRPYKTETRKLRAKGPLATAEMKPELL
ncbi:uncharacterized protein LOC122571768 [Bombus pyrosoma]|uniref:uncharacterized protein LOC122571768 n=1 Tax=Bombus pyrosoma TaxID=396416 RepID=UPI001CB9C235|nr:uncharacterized protein LOC122571768 [Bombus pyrosoma]